MKSECVGRLRLVSTAPPAPLELSPAHACLDAFDRELDYIFATLRRLGASRHEIEDLAQELFVVLQRNWDNLDTHRSLRPYLFGIAFRIVRAQQRRRAREVLSVDVELQDNGSSPESTLQNLESLGVLWSALDSVPITRRAVLIMHELDEIPIADIAKSLGISRFGVYARLRRGRVELAAAVRRIVAQGARR